MQSLFLLRRTLVTASILLLAAAKAHALYGTAFQMQLGNPTGATNSLPASHTHFLIQRDEYAMDYNDQLHNPNWVSWDLTIDDVGSIPRPDFTTDPALTAAGLTALSTRYYTGLESGIIYNRGHICPNGDRNITADHQAKTFYMSNIIPQATNVNGGVWENFENYCRLVARSGFELLTISGPSTYGNHTWINTTNNPAIALNIPSNCWKIVVAVPSGPGTALNRIDRACPVFALIVPNENGAGSLPWTNFLTTVSQIEQITGYTFFTALPHDLADEFRARRTRIIPDFSESTLRAAITSAAPYDALLFTNSSTAQTINLHGELSIANKLSISAAFTPGVFLNPGASDRALEVTPNGWLRLVSVNVTNGISHSSNGGAILNNGILYLHNCMFTANTSVNGGAIYNGEMSTFSANQCVFSNNLCSWLAGAIFFGSGEAEIKNSIFVTNTSTMAGGAIASVTNGTLTLFNCKFTNNTSTSGGAVVSGPVDTSFQADTCTFSGNTAKSFGGAIAISGGDALVKNSTFINNACAGNGGALYGLMDVTNCTFLSNSSQLYGGAIWFGTGPAGIFNSTFGKNKAANGGGIYSTSYEGVLSQSTITNNTATQQGGGIYLNVVGTVNLGSTINGNTAPNSADVYGSFENSSMHGLAVSNVKILLAPRLIPSDALLKPAAHHVTLPRRAPKRTSTPK